MEGASPVAGASLANTVIYDVDGPGRNHAFVPPATGGSIDRKRRGQGRARAAKAGQGQQWVQRQQPPQQPPPHQLQQRQQPPPH